MKLSRDIIDEDERKHWKKLSVCGMKFNAICVWRHIC